MISFRRILIQNFKRYRRVEIRPEEDRGLFVFIGKNYLGKSTFLNALCWCLYDDQPFRESIEKNISHEHSLLNEDAKRENQFDEVRVELEIQDEEKIYLFVRTWRPSQQSHFQVMLKRGKDWAPLLNPTVIVDSLLPRDLREYFIFAGEDAESMFSPGYEKKLKSGVWKVSNIEVLDRLIDHIDIIYTEVQRQLARKSAGDSTQQAVEKKTELEKEKAEKSSRLGNIREEISKFTETRGEYMEKIKQSAAYSEKIKRREILERRRGEIDKNLEKFHQDTNNLITEKAPFLYLEPILKAIRDRLKTDEEAGSIPPSIRTEFIGELLKGKKCICGRALGHDDGSEDALRKLLERIEPADRRAPLLEDRYPIQEFLRQIPEIDSNLQELQSSRATLLHEEENLERELKNISEELAGAPEAEISGLEDGIRRIENTLDNDRRDEALIVHRLHQIEEEVQEIDAQIRKDATEQGALGALKKRLEVLEAAKDSASFVRERITDRVRRVLSKSTEDYFRELFWEQEEYESIEFTADYKLNVKKRGFSEPSTEFSSGEKKVLGIAALRAIADLSGFSGVPIFFDAPLTKLGPEIEENILKMLPRLAPNKQVFIFNLDVEKIIDFSKTLGKGRVYELRKDVKSKNSTIIIPIHA